MYRVSVFAGFIAVGSTASNVSTAEPVICGSLHQQLALPRGEGSSSSGVYRPAVQRQAINLQQMRIRARQAGCGTGLFSRGDPVQCASVKRSVAGKCRTGEARRRQTCRIAPAHHGLAAGQRLCSVAPEATSRDAFRRKESGRDTAPCHQTKEDKA